MTDDHRTTSDWARSLREKHTEQANRLSALLPKKWGGSNDDADQPATEAPRTWSDLFQDNDPNN